MASRILRIGHTPSASFLVVVRNKKLTPVQRWSDVTRKCLKAGLTQSRTQG